MAGDMTATTMDKWIPEHWSDIATETERSNTVLVPLMDHTWEAELQQGSGDTANIPAFSQNAASNVVKRSTFGTGAGLTFQNTTESQKQLVINTMVYTAYRVPVELTGQFMPAYLTRLSKGAGQAIQLYIDNDLASDNTNGIDSFTTTVGTDNVDVSEDNLLTSETDIATNNGDPDDRFGVVSPATKQSMFKIESVRQSLYATSMGNLDGSKTRGYLGKWMTLAFYESNNLEAGVGGKKNGVFQRKAIAFAEQQSLKSVRDLNIEDGLFNQYAYYSTYGFLKIKDGLGVELDGK